MTDIKCEVIQDLLQLYVDELTSEESNKLIESHLEKCNECREFLDALKEKDPNIDDSSLQIDNEVENKIINNIKKQLFTAKVICLAIGILAGLYVTFFINQFQFILIYPIIGCLGYFIVKKIWITPLLALVVSLIGCIIMNKIPGSIMLSLANSFFTLIGCIIAYALKKIFERL